MHTTEQAAIAVGELGETLSALRLCEPSAVEMMSESLTRNGQLTPLIVFEQDGGLEIIDGFKPLHAARRLGWPGLRVMRVETDQVAAKIHLTALHTGRGLTELEEGWVVRSLHRDDRLSQGAIAERLGRHKSWVCRLLMLVEALESEVQASVRLGLLTPRVAVVLAALPRGNQVAAHPAHGDGFLRHATHLIQDCAPLFTKAWTPCSRPVVSSAGPSGAESQLQSPCGKIHSHSQK